MVVFNRFPCLILQVLFPPCPIVLITLTNVRVYKCSRVPLCSYLLLTLIILPVFQTLCPAFSFLFLWASVISIYFVLSSVWIVQFILLVQCLPAILVKKYTQQQCLFSEIMLTEKT